MIRTCQIIYDRLHDVNNVESGQAVRFLAEKQKIQPTNEIYGALISQISSLREKYLPVGFIERFCLARISEYILLKYPVNVAEAFLLSYVLLNKPVDINMAYLKLGTSGLIAPTMIRGTKIADVEEIAKFIITSLTDADLIKMTEHRFLIPGKLLYLDI